jgi:hypothetical protein
MYVSLIYQAGKLCFNTSLTAFFQTRETENFEGNMHLLPDE